MLAGSGDRSQSTHAGQCPGPELVGTVRDVRMHASRADGDAQRNIDEPALDSRELGQAGSIRGQLLPGDPAQRMQQPVGQHVQLEGARVRLPRGLVSYVPLRGARELRLEPTLE